VVYPLIGGLPCSCSGRVMPSRLCSERETGTRTLSTPAPPDPRIEAQIPGRGGPPMAVPGRTSLGVHRGEARGEAEWECEGEREGEGRAPGRGGTPRAARGDTWGDWERDEKGLGSWIRGPSEDLWGQATGGTAPRGTPPATILPCAVSGATVPKCSTEAKS